MSEDKLQPLVKTFAIVWMKDVQVVTFHAQSATPTNVDMSAGMSLEQLLIQITKFLFPIYLYAWLQALFSYLFIFCFINPVGKKLAGNLFYY